MVRYFRAQDYLTWLLGTAAGPGLLVLFERMEPLEGRKFRMPPHSLLRVSTLVGVIGGFILAYNESSKRFWGWSENGREVQKDRYEVKKLLSQGKSPYGVSTMSDYLQDMSARNTTSSQLVSSVLPIFNFANHQNHGIDLRKYYEVREGEEKWGFNDLVPLDQIKGLAIGNQYNTYSNYSEDF